MKNYKITYTYKKIRTSSVRIKGKEIQITLSRYLSHSEEKKAIEKFLKWAEKKINQKTYKTPFTKEFKDRGVIKTHNCTYTIQIIQENRKTISTKIDEAKTITIKANKSLSKSEIQEKVEKIIINDRLIYIKELIDELNQLHFQEKINKIRIKKVKTRLGSCSSKRDITIAYKLLFMPKEILEYVCIHELAHLKEMNHSKNFWALVQEAMPEYKTHEKWLKQNSFAIE